MTNKPKTRSWKEDIKEAKVPLVPGMKIVAGITQPTHVVCVDEENGKCTLASDYSQITIETYCSGVVPDLDDRATFLLCLDELAKRKETVNWEIWTDGWAIWPDAEFSTIDSGLMSGAFDKDPKIALAKALKEHHETRSK